MFDIIAVDWGEKRCGIAFGDQKTDLVIAYKKDCYTQEVWEILAEEISQKKIKIAVIGLPSNFNGKPTEVTKKIELFIENFKVVFPGIEVITLNERNSTKEALIGYKIIDKHIINHQAAAKILEYYFTDKSLRK